MSSDDPKEQMQGLLLELQELVGRMADVAERGGIERVPFLGENIHFGRTLGGHYDYRRDKWIDGRYLRAVNGPIVSNEYWSASSFDCWPSDEQREWLFGPDVTTWPRTSYNDE